MTCCPSLRKEWLWSLHIGGLLWVYEARPTASIVKPAFCAMASPTASFVPCSAASLYLNRHRFAGGRLWKPAVAAKGNGRFYRSQPFGSASAMTEMSHCRPSPSCDSVLNEGQVLRSRFKRWNVRHYSRLASLSFASATEAALANASRRAISFSLGCPSSDQ